MTDAEILVWLRKDQRKRVVLVELDYRYQVGVSENAVPTTGTLYFSNFAYVDEAASPIQRYQAAILEAPEYERSLDRKTLRGRYNTSVGSLILNNADGEFDYILDLALDGSEVRVYVGDETWIRDDFVHLYTALSVKASASRKKVVTIDLRDPALLLNKSIGGTVTVGGSEPSANSYRPLNFGYVHQVEPILYDSMTDTYVHSDTGDNTVAVDVRNDGVSVSFTDNANGTFALAVSPAGNEKITCDVRATVSGSPSSTTSYRLSDAMTELIGVRAGMIDAGRFTGPGAMYELQGFNDYHVGINVPQARNVIEILDDLCDTANGFWAFTRLGSFYYSWMRPESLSAFTGTGIPVSAEIVEDDIRGDSLSIDHNIPTYAGYQAYGNVNWTSQSTFSSSLTTAERAVYERVGYVTASFFGESTGSPASEAYRGDSVSWRGGRPELYHLSLSDSQLVRTLISGPDDTSVVDPADDVPQSVENYLQDWASIRRSQNLPWVELVDVTVGLDFYALELGDIVSLTFPRHGLDAGVFMQVAKVRLSPSNASVALSLVRRRFADVAVAPHMNGYLLQEDLDHILLQNDFSILT